jgi:excisionase family DNA binding protein
MENKDFYTVDEFAEIVDANRKTVYEDIARKKIPVIRIGRLILIPGAWVKRAASMTEPSEAA